MRPMNAYTLPLFDAPTPTLPPPLKWAGGKRWLVPVLTELWKPLQRRRLVEPFVGGMAVTLGLQPAHALLNDSNPHLITFYRWLQRGLVIDFPLENEREAYYRLRERFNHLIRSPEAEGAEVASLFYYLNRTCFNGLCRFNRRGEFNVPKGSYKQITYTYDFRAYAPVLAPWEFSVGDFSALTLMPNDFIYADPPYDVQFTAYSAGGFSWEDQVRLAEWLAVHPGPVVTSNQATERILALYAGLGFTLRVLDAPRLIACNGDRTPAKEMLAHRNF